MALTHSHAYRLARIATVAGMALATVPAFGQAVPAPGNVQAAPQAHGATISLADLAERVMPAVVNIAAVTTSETRGRNLPQLPQLGPDTPFGDLFEEFFNRRGRGG
jgi:serine protease Do